MNSSSNNEARRCRPLLGTLVEITAAGPDEVRLNAAIQAAFAAIDAIQRLMSAHDESSELSEINRSAHRQPVRVSEPTFAVLSRGLAIARQSEGAFDFTVAPTLARWGLLPATLRRRQTRGDWRDVELLPRRRVSFRRPLAVDLGGIAKGYAVDQAIRVLRQHGVAYGVVNAGGDLRAFGPESATVHLRHPAHPPSLLNPLTLRDEALATSSPCFTRSVWRDQTVSHLVTVDRRAVTQDISVSVRAPECWLADALTKVVLNAPARAGRLLALHGAEAWILTA